MTHLSPETFVDIAEGGAPGAPAAAHLHACEACRRHLGALRETMSAAAGVNVPEPSPFFWDQLSRRVRDGVRAEGAPRRWPALRPAWMLAPLAAAAALAVVVGLRWSSQLPAPAPRPPALASAALEPLPVGLAPLPDDPALDLVAGLAANMDYDSASELAATDITAHPGVVEESVAGMSASERAELGRLIDAEMKKGE